MSFGSLLWCSATTGCRTPYRRDASSPEGRVGAKHEGYAHRSDPRFPSDADRGREGVWFEEPWISGRLSPEAVGHVAVEHLGQIRACRRRATSTETLSGRLVLEIEVRSDGTVASAEVRETSLHDAAFQQCLLKAVRSWRMPATEGPNPATVQLPIDVRAEPEADR